MCILKLFVKVLFLSTFSVSNAFLEGQTTTSTGQNDVSNLLKLLVEEKTLRQQLERRVDEMSEQLNTLKDRDCGSVTCGENNQGTNKQIESLIHTVQTIELNKDNTHTDIKVLQENVTSIIDDNANLKHTVQELQKEKAIVNQELKLIQAKLLNQTYMERNIAALQMSVITLQNENSVLKLSTQTLKNNYSVLQQSLQALQNDSGVLQQNVQTIQNNVQKLKQENNNMNGTIQTLQTAYSKMQLELTTLQQQQLNDTKSLQNTLSSIKTNQSQLKNQLTSVENRQQTFENQEINKTNAIEASVTNLKQAKDALETDLQDLLNKFNQFKMKETNVTDSLTTTISKLSQKQNSITNDVTNLSNTISTLQQQQNSNSGTIHRLDTLSQSINTKLTSTVQSVQNLAGNVKSITDNIATIRGAVGFTVRLTTGTFFSGRTYKASQTLPFSNVVKSIGGGFNTTDGSFYCPKSGTYLFEVTLSSYSPAASVNIVVNGQSLAYGFTSLNANNIYESGTVMQIVHLDVGDKVWVRSRGNYFIENYSYFSGVLVTP